MTHIKKRDKVVFLQPTYTVYDKEGEEVYVRLRANNIYTVKEVGIISLSLEGIGGSYLKEHFRKIKDD